ncbi:MAG: hypothetical protein WCE62_10235, partial [Polyangiales bacterium]
MASSPPPERFEQQEHGPKSGRSASRKIRAAKRWALALAASVALLLAFASRSHAQPHRVGAELWGQLGPNAGLIILEGSTRKYPYVDVEALVWGGAGDTQYDLSDDAFTFEALVLALKLRDPRGISDTRLGRFILSTGAVRAVQIDG